MTRCSTEHEQDGDVATIVRHELRMPSSWKVVLLNDDDTSMDFVVQVLMAIFNKPFDEAVKLMLSVHENGRATAGLYTKEVAQTKVKEVHREASAYGFPLVAVAEEA